MSRGFHFFFCLIYGLRLFQKTLESYRRGQNEQRTVQKQIPGSRLKQHNKADNRKNTEHNGRRCLFRRFFSFYKNSRNHTQDQKPGRLCNNLEKRIRRSGLIIKIPQRFRQTVVFLLYIPVKFTFVTPCKGSVIKIGQKLSGIMGSETFHSHLRDTISYLRERRPIPLRYT